MFPFLAELRPHRIPTHAKLHAIHSPMISSIMIRGAIVEVLIILMTAIY